MPIIEHDLLHPSPKVVKTQHKKKRRRAIAAAVLAVALLAGIFARPLLLLFTESDAEMIRVGAFSLRSQCLVMPLHGYCIMVNMLSAGIGRGRAAALLSMSRQGLFFFPVLPLMVGAFGQWGVASVQAVGDVLSMIPALFIIKRTMSDIAALEKTPQPIDK